MRGGHNYGNDCTWSQLRRTTGIVLILCLIHLSLDFKIVFEETSVYICKHIYTQAPAGDAWGIWVYLQFVILQIQENAQIHEQISISSYCKRHCLNHPAVSNSFKACGKLELVRFPNPPGLRGLTGLPVLKRFWKLLTTNRVTRPSSRYMLVHLNVGCWWIYNRPPVQYNH